MFSITCESCAAKLKVRQASAINQVLACPKCGAMIKVVAPEGWSPESTSPTAPQTNNPIRPSSPVAHVPKKLGDTDFADIDKLIKEQEAKENAAPLLIPAVKIPKPTKPANAPNSGKATTAAEEKQPNNEKILLPGNNWTSPQAERRRRMLFFSAVGLASVLLLGISIYFVATYFKKEDSTVAIKPAEVDSPKKAGEIEEPVTKNNSDTKSDKAKSLPVDQSNSSAADANEKTGVDDKTEMAIKNPDESLAKSNTPPALPSKDDLPLVSPIAADGSKKASDEKMQNGQPNPINALAPTGEKSDSTKKLTSDSVVPSVLMEQKAFADPLGEMSRLIAEANTSIGQIQDLANLERTTELPGIPNVFIERVDIQRRQSLADVMQVVVPQLKYENVALRQFVQDISVLANVTIGFSARDLIAAGIDLDQKISISIENVPLKNVLDKALAEANLSASVMDWGILIDLQDSNVPIEQTLDFPRLADPLPHEFSEMAQSLQKMIEPATWAPELKTGISVGDKKFEVTQFPRVHSKIRRLFEKINACQLPESTSSPEKFPALLIPTHRKADELLKKDVAIEISSPLTLDEFFLRLQKQIGLAVLLDWPALSKEGWNYQTVVPMYFKAKNAEEALNQICRAMEVTFDVIDETTVLITTFSAAAATRDLEFYPIGDITSDTIKPELVVGLLNQTVGAHVVNNLQSPILLNYYDKCQCIIIVGPQSIQRRIDRVIARLRKRESVETK